MGYTNKPTQMRRWICAAVVVFMACGRMSKPGAPETHHRPIEMHHSLHTPFDQSQVYWKFGGATVMTKAHARLTPASANNRGWLWNDYPLESDDWELEVSMRVSSEPHFGGDGFGIWVLSGDHDPMYHWEPDYLNGPVFGLREDFKGFGVIFDTYDNDGGRNNPSVFAVENYDGRLDYDHDNDFTGTMITNRDSVSHRCYSNYRNTKADVKVMVRFLKSTLHVYVHDNPREAAGEDYKFCFAVKIDFPGSFQERHLAFTGMTGQVADLVDITQISLRYIDDSDASIDDAALAHAEGHSVSTRQWMFWGLLLLLNASLLLWANRDLGYVTRLGSAQANVVYLCNELNSLVLAHMVVYISMCALLVLWMAWWPVLLNLPMLGYRVRAVATNSYFYDPAALSGGGKASRLSVPYSRQLYATVALYALNTLYSLVCLIRA